jgi:hypothetical protein
MLLALLALTACGQGENAASPSEAAAVTWTPTVALPPEPPLPAAVVARHRPTGEAAAAFDQRYAVQLRCLPYANATTTPEYEECINVDPPPAWCQQASWCASLETDIMAMFLEHYRGNPSEIGRSGTTACQREVEEEVARQGPAVRTTLSSVCAASDMIDAAIAARWAARQRENAR